jgi:hypothetical protein
MGLGQRLRSRDVGIGSRAAPILDLESITLKTKTNPVFSSAMPEEQDWVRFFRACAEKITDIKKAPRGRFFNVRKT